MARANEVFLSFTPTFRLGELGSYRHSNLLMVSVPRRLNLQQPVADEKLFIYDVFLSFFPI